MFGSNFGLFLLLEIQLWVLSTRWVKLWPVSILWGPTLGYFYFLGFNISLFLAPRCGFAALGLWLCWIYAALRLGGCSSRRSPSGGAARPLLSHQSRDVTELGEVWLTGGVL